METDDITCCFREAQFNRYITLTRMSRLNKPAESITNSEWFAELNDVHAVDEIINENMDPLCEQIPDIEEIANAVQNHQILVARHQSDVAAILYFERTGISTILRFWATRKKYHGLGFGGKVYERYLAVNADAKRWLLWVRDDNLKVKQIYQNYGMNFENLQDSVYLWAP